MGRVDSLLLWDLTMYGFTQICKMKVETSISVLLERTPFSNDSLLDKLERSNDTSQLSSQYLIRRMKSLSSIDEVKSTVLSSFSSVSPMFSFLFPINFCSVPFESSYTSTLSTTTTSQLFPDLFLLFCIFHCSQCSLQFCVVVV